MYNHTTQTLLLLIYLCLNSWYPALNHLILKELSRPISWFFFLYKLSKFNISCSQTGTCICDENETHNLALALLFLLFCRIFHLYLIFAPSPIVDIVHSHTAIALFLTTFTFIILYYPLPLSYLLFFPNIKSLFSYLHCTAKGYGK